MRKRRAFTLLEVVVAITAMSLLVISMYQIINSTVIYTVSGVSSVKAQDEIKQITETLRINVANATEMYILEKEPETKDNTYMYFYSRKGVVYYYNMEENAVDISEKVFNHIKFEGDDASKILKYTVSANQKKGDKSSNSSIYIKGLENGINKIKNIDSVNSGNCIMFRVHSDTSVITNFILNSGEENPTLDIPIQGMIQDGAINLYVPENPNKTNKKYIPTVTFVGDRVVVSDKKFENLEEALEKEAQQSNGYELEKKEIDFANPVYYYVISNEKIRMYEVKLIVGNVKIKIYQEGRNGEAITDIIRFDKDFKVSGISTSGTVQWYTEGRTEPVKEVEITSSDVDLTLTPNELYSVNDNILQNDYNYQNQGKYEDIMRYITVRFKPTGSDEWTYAIAPKLIYPVSETAESQVIGQDEKDFYLKVATDIWIESKGKETFIDSVTGKSGVDAVAAFKEMYKIANNNREEYESIAKLNKNQAPEFVRVMYDVDMSNYEVKPRILAIGDTAAYSRTILGVDLVEYGLPVDKINSYEVSATYADAEFKKINGVNTVNTDNNGDLDACMSIGIFADDNMNGFRALAGVNKSKGYVKSVNYKDSNVSETTDFSNLNIMQEYVLDNAYTLKNENEITFNVKAFRQNNDDNTVMYYANVEDEKGTRLGRLEDANNMKQGKPELVGEGNKSTVNMLVGDNFYAGDSVNTMRTANGTTTTGNVITFGMAVDKSNGKKYAQYITEIELDLADDYELELKDAEVIGHTIIDDMLGTDKKPKTATIVKLEFNGDVRSGHNENSTDNANIDGDIVNNILDKHIKTENLDDGKYTTIVKPEDEYVQNLVADKKHISFTGGGETFNVLHTSDKQYAYKTANGNGADEGDTIILLVDGVLENNKSYDINLSMGSIRAVYGGDVNIEVGGRKIVGRQVNIETDDNNNDDNNTNTGDVFNISKDVFNNGDKPIVDKQDGNDIQADWKGEYTYDNTIFINNQDNSIGGGGDQHYTPDMFKYTFKGDPAYVTAEDGFIIEATTMRNVEYAPGGESRHESHSIFGKIDNSNNTYGYTLYVVDVGQGTEEEPKCTNKPEDNKMSAMSILSTKNDMMLGADGTIIDPRSNFRPNTQYTVNGVYGRLYFQRKANIEYTFRATFKNDKVTMQVLDEKGMPVDTYIKITYDTGETNLVATKDLQGFENGFEMQIPKTQLHTGVKYNQIGFRGGGGLGNWGSGFDRVFYNKYHGFVIKSLK